MAQARQGHAAVLLHDGRVMVIGGRYFTFGTNKEVIDESLASVEIFDPATGTWSEGPSLHRWRENPVAVVLHDGRVLVLGGFEGVGDVRKDDDPTAELFDPSTDAWTVLQHVPFWVTGAVVLESGAVLTIGALDGGADNASSSSLLDPSTLKFGTVKGVPGISLNPGVVALADGRVLVAGGARGYEGGPEARSEAAIYDPASAAWAPIEPMPEPQYQHGILTLPDGRVMVLGSSPTELFDPESGHWTVGPSTASNREMTHLVPIADRRVLAIGSFSGTIDALPIIEAFDSRLGTWSAVTAFPIIDSMSTTLLPDGRILIAGGLLECRFGQECEDQRVLDNAWLLDPADLP